MSNAWYPSNKRELSEVLGKFLKAKIKPKKINGLIVPHAGYQYSGAIAGKVFSMLKNKKNKTAVILSPSHYFAMHEIATHNQEKWSTPLGELKILKTKIDFTKTNISIEHGIDNQIPFLQELNFREILPLIVGELTQEQIIEAAKKIAKLKAVIIVSTDLSHFLPYEQAVERDKETINAIESLDSNKIRYTDNCACGVFPLLIFMEICRIKKFKPKLIEYKNSGDVVGGKDSVVGYSSFVF